jgi:hypothetical protein
LSSKSAATPEQLVLDLRGLAVPRVREREHHRLPRERGVAHEARALGEIDVHLHRALHVAQEITPVLLRARLRVEARAEHRNDHATPLRIGAPRPVAEQIPDDLHPGIMPPRSALPGTSRGGERFTELVARAQLPMIEALLAARSVED